jgi:alanine dehydrogenase
VLLNIGEKGGIDDLLFLNKNVRQGLYLYKGSLTNKSIGEWFDLPYTESDLHF